MPYIPLEEVESSNIVAIGYHRQSQTLRMRFQGDRYYDYPMVLESEYEALMAAESKGTFFNSRIKPMYGHRSVREEALLEPCCEHQGSDTCSPECFPCKEWCCPGAPSPETVKAVTAAVTLGMKTGASLAAAVRAVVECECPDAALNCNNSCECPCHVSAVPPAVPLTPDGEIDVDQIPDVTHLFREEGDDEAEEDMHPVQESSSDDTQPESD